MMEHALMGEENLESGYTGEQYRKQKDNQTRKRWCMFIAGSLALVSMICLGFYIFTDTKNPNNTNNMVNGEPHLTHANLCDTCAMLPDNFDDYCIGHTCPFEDSEDYILNCPTGYGDVQITRVKLGRHDSARDLVLLQREAISQMRDLEEYPAEGISLNLAELRGDLIIDSSTFPEDDCPPNDVDCIMSAMVEDCPPEDLDCIENATGVEEEPVIQLNRHGHHHDHGDWMMPPMPMEPQVRMYFICNRMAPSSAIRLTQPLQMPEYEEMPFLSAAMVRCGGSKKKADYLEGGKVCDKAGDFHIECALHGDNPRVIIMKVREKRDKTITRTKQERKDARAQERDYLAAANDYCGGNVGSCDLDAAALGGGLKENWKYKVSYLCSFTSVIEDAAPPPPIFLGSPWETEEELDESEGLFLSARVKCGQPLANVGNYVQEGKACTEDNANGNDDAFAIQCDHLVVTRELS
eukprot:UN01998